MHQRSTCNIILNHRVIREIYAQYSGIEQKFMQHSTIVTNKFVIIFAQIQILVLYIIILYTQHKMLGSPVDGTSSLEEAKITAVVDKCTDTKVGIHHNLTVLDSEHVPTTGLILCETVNTSISIHVLIIMLGLSLAPPPLPLSQSSEPDHSLCSAGCIIVGGVVWFTRLSLSFPPSNLFMKGRQTYLRCSLVIPDGFFNLHFSILNI